MKRLLANIFKNDFYRGGVVLTGTSFLVNVLNYGFNVLVGRYIGPAGYGEIYALFSYITLLSIPISIVSTLIIQKIGTAKGDKVAYSQSLEQFFHLKMKKYIPFFLLSLLFIPILPRITNLSILTSIVLIPLIILSLVTSIYTSILNGLKFFFIVSVVSLLGTVIKLLSAVLVAAHLGGIEVIIIGLIFAAAFSFLASLWLLSKKVKKTQKTSHPPIEKRLSQIITSTQFIVVALSITAITALNNIDIIFVKKFFNAQEAGLYSSWSLFAKGIFYVLGPLLFVSYVFFAHTKNAKNQKRSFLISFFVLIIFSIISYVFYSFFAKPIITIFFGSRFTDIVPYLGQASIYGSCYAIITFMNNYFIARNNRSVLILPISLPIYILTLFLIQKNLPNIYILDDIYAFVIVLSYLTAFFLSRE